MSLAVLKPPRLGSSPEDDQRNLLQWLFQLWQVLSGIDADNRLTRLENTVNAISELSPLTQAISNPPTQAQVQAIQDKVNSIITAAALPAL